MVPCGRKAASRQLVRRADAVNVLDAGQHFEVARVKIDARAHGSEHRLALAGRAVHGKAHADQVFDHVLDLLIGCEFLHGNNHRNARRSSVAISSKRRSADDRGRKTAPASH